MKTKVYLVAALFLGSMVPAHGQNDAVPPDLKKAFDRYERAWTERDWGRLFDFMAPAVQKVLLDTYKTREGWMKMQEGYFKDTIKGIERRETYRMSDTLYSFAITTHGTHPNGKPFSVEAFASFELIDGEWCLIDPVVPQKSKPKPQPKPKTESPPSSRPEVNPSR